MQITGIAWKQRFVDKIEAKHGVQQHEVEEVVFGKPLIRLSEKGRIRGENLYVAYGQTLAGRYLAIFFIHKLNRSALPISARDMTMKERSTYEKHRK